MVAHDSALAQRLRRHLDRPARTSADPDARGAAVAITVTRDEHGGAALLLIKRAARMRAHPGQWALPGGRVDPGETVHQAALRELHEELAIPPHDADVLGRLDDYVTKSGYVISPVVVWLAGQVTPVPNAAEVASVHALSLRELDAAEPRFAEAAGADGPVLQLPVLGRRIHAPTGAILLAFREQGLHGRDVDVNAFHEPPFAWR